MEQQEMLQFFFVFGKKLYFCNRKRKTEDGGQALIPILIISELSKIA